MNSHTVSGRTRAKASLADASFTGFVEATTTRTGADMQSTLIASGWLISRARSKPETDEKSADNASFISFIRRINAMH